MADRGDLSAQKARARQVGRTERPIQYQTLQVWFIDAPRGLRRRQPRDSPLGTFGEPLPLTSYFRKENGNDWSDRASVTQHLVIDEVANR